MGIINNKYDEIYQQFSHESFGPNFEWKWIKALSSNFARIKAGSLDYTWMSMTVRAFWDLRANLSSRESHLFIQFFSEGSVEAR